MLILPSRTINMLIRQKEAQGQTFAQDGGFREQLSTVRIEARAQAQCAPACPVCSKPMARRTARVGPNAGRAFWGCTGFPGCQGARKIERQESTGSTSIDEPLPEEPRSRRPVDTRRDPSHLQQEAS